MDKKDKDKEDEDEGEINKKDKDKEDEDVGEVDKKDKDKDESEMDKKDKDKEDEDEKKTDAASSDRVSEKLADNPPATGSIESEATSTKVFQDARSYATAELNESPNNAARKDSISNNEPVNPILDADSKANTKIRYKQSISKTELTSTSRGIGISTRRRENIVHNQTVTTNKRKKLTGQPIGHKGIVKLPNINDDYVLDNRSRQNYADCEYHFPSANRWQNIWYDGKQNKYFSRHARNWRYSAIYVAGFIIFMLFFNTAIFRRLTDNLNMTTPVIQMSQPFLIFAPTGSKTEHKLIRYTPRNDTHGGHMRNRLSDFLSRHGRSKGQIKRFGPCQEDNNFGYSTSEPCVFLKINRLIGFKTKPYKYDSEVVRSSFEQVDYTALMRLLLSIPNEENRKDRIWITCTSPSTDAYVDFYPEAAFKTKYVDAEKFKDIKIQNEVPQDRTIVTHVLRTVSLPLFVCMCTISCCGIFVAFALIIFNIWNKHRRVIQSSHPVCNTIMLFGVIICLISVILLGIDGRFVSPHEYPKICQARAWLLSTGFTLAYGAMFSKVWRVHRFTTKAKTDPKKKVEPWKLYTMVSGLLSIDLVILLCWQIFDPLQRILETFPLEDPVSTTDDIKIRPELEHCESERNSMWLGLVYGVKGLILVFGLFLAYETRSIKVKQINDSRYVGMSIYNVVVLCLITAPVGMVIASQQDASFAFVALAVIFCCFLSMLLIFVPKVIEVIRHPKDKAESKYNPDSAISKEDEERYQKLVTENEELQRLITQKEEKIRVLRQRLVERDVNTKSTELNGASGAGIAVGGSNGNGGTATTSLAVQSQAAAIISTAASAHPTPAATLAITQDTHEHRT
ncbi:uncharacterized protein LOC115758995 isoform X1 [Drosophila novamexicana]|uniref:uncharacterized protein LOC115758995 isoform X1 n=1 Tax=Drosophila novamexicana TaxID=47314 RepID=UPI0011E5CA4E|nr:uncharacterized protein LOC115758995 isoform X1 [Drosophila novamexicana]